MARAAEPVGGSLVLDGVPASEVWPGVVDLLTRQGSATTPLGDGETVVIAARHRPWWTYVLAVALFPVGLLALLVRETRTQRLVVTDGPRGVLICGYGAGVGATLELLRSSTAELRSSVTHQLVPPERAPVAAVAPPPAVGDRRLTAPEAEHHAPAEADLQVAHAEVASPAGSTLVLPDHSTVKLDIGARVVLGRDPRSTDADVPIAVGAEALTVSKTHAMLVCDASGLWIEDMHSTNGTAVATPNGDVTPLRPGSPAMVPRGGFIRLGDLQIQHTDESPG